jgi:hypothetical protein
MKVQTNLKAGSGCGCNLLDLYAKVQIGCVTVRASASA